MKSFLSCCLLIVITILAHSQVYPPPACIYYDNGTLIVCPPDSVPEYTGGLLGYNVFVDGEFVENLPVGSPDDSVTTTFDPLPMPGYREFCATANYTNWISEFTCDTAFVQYGDPLPFSEDWSSGSFETNNWTHEGEQWVIDEGTGNSSPSAKFISPEDESNYFYPLVSCFFIADTNALKEIYIEFDVKLESNTSTGDEILYCQYWRWQTQSWYGTQYWGKNNGGGSLDWTHFSRTLNYADSGPLMIRIVAQGQNSADISAWYVDNVKLIQDCGNMGELVTFVNDDGEAELNWQYEFYCHDLYFIWLEFCNYMSSGTSIGTGSEAEFDVAAVWTPELLDAQDVEAVSAIRFFPAEAQAQYSLRIWEGDSATLVYEQPVENPAISQWNEIPLDPVYPVDVTQKLWIGYHINTITGYPAGVDDGPAHDGAGNMMYWEDHWSTLLEISPDLDYNWLIQAYPLEEYPSHCKTRIYKKVGDGDYVMINQSPGYDYYVDSQADLEQVNCYKVTNVNLQYPDTCESDFSNESCLYPVGVQEDVFGNDLDIFPIPAHDHLFVESSSEIIELQMIDMAGRVLYEERNPDQAVSIPVRNLSQGIYLMKVSFKDNRVYRKVLID